MRCLALLLIVLVTGCATTISGVVKDAAGKPVNQADARINITELRGDGGEGANQVLHLDAQGRFQSRSVLREGPYLVEALVPGYRSQSLTVEVKGSQQVELILSPATAPRASSVGANTEIEVGRGGGAASLTPPNL